MSQTVTQATTQRSDGDNYNGLLLVQHKEDVTTLEEQAIQGALGQTEGGPRLTDGNGILAKLRMNETDCTAHKHIGDLQHSVHYSRQVTSV
ncbi:hypothetical protein M8J75_003416 [Diaphorina citri]|nr:hypothetical protein M8J75_003416 [Diaphorina citri]